ncbi:MAG: sigma-70 family RNA polymerase sigma factor [Gemmataceae bacterium]
MERSKLTSKQSQMVTKNIGLVRAVVKQMAQVTPLVKRHYDDCIQIGCLALIDAVRNWKPERGKFGAYGWRVIWRRIRDLCPKEQSPNDDRWQLTLEATPSTHELREYVHNLLAKLPARDRKIVWSVYAMGIQKKAIGAKFGLKYGEINEILERASTTLRQLHESE